MKTKTFFRALLVPVMLLFFFTSCKKEANDAISDENMISSEATVTTNAAESRMIESQLLKSVRQVTSRFNSTNQALEAGYLQETHCVVSPTGAGGMGYHWPKPSLIDNAFDPMQPEVLLYATGPGGNLKLVAVEYLVMNTGQTRPNFDGRLFDIGGAPIPVPHWTLHVWLHEHNPSGIFARFNPNVTCP